MRKYFGWKSALLIAFLCGLGSSRAFSQQLLSSFEGNLSSSVGASWQGPGISSTEFVPEGATEGTSALAVHHSPSWDGNNPAPIELEGGMQLAQAVASHDFLLFDVTTTDSGIAGDGWSPGYRIMWPIILTNATHGGWHQPGQIDIPVAADDGGSFTYNAVFDLTTANIKADAQAFVDSPGADPIFRLIFAMIGGDQGSGPKAGDYGPADNLVNAADYVTWRQNLNGTTLTNETVSPGIVDAADYDEWRANFGKDYTRITTIFDNIRFANAGSGAGGVSGSAAPEPSSVILVVMGSLVVGLSRRLRK
jgi:hypothetical protein